MTLTLVLDAQKADEPVQSSSVSSDFTRKLPNLENPSPTDNEIASLMETLARHATTVPKITSGFTTTIPPPPSFFNPLLQHATPALTPTTSKATTSFTSFSDFASVFKFKERVTNLEKDLSEIKQFDQYAQALSSIPTMVNRHMDIKLGKAINKAIQAHNFDYVLTPVIEKNVTESLEATVLKRSSSQPQSLYEAAETLSEFELIKILIDKMERNKSYDIADHKRELYDALVKSYQIDKDLSDSYGEVFSLKRSRDDRDKDRDPSTGSDRGTKRRKSKELSHIVEDSGMQQDQEFIMGNNDNQPADKEISQVARAEEPPTSFDELNDTSFDFSTFVMNRLKIPNLTKEILVGLTFNLLKEDQKLYKFREDDFPRLYLQDIEDMLLLLVQNKLTNLTIDERYDLNVALRMFTRQIVIQRRVGDLQLGAESYQKKLNLTKPDTFRSNLINKTTYTRYSDPKGVIYKDQMNRNRLMRADELHKFSDGTLDDVRSALNDIAKGIRMEYLPKRKWSGLDKRRARVMVQDIDKKLFERRLMRNLEKFIGGREYGNDLRLLERTI
ncbi:hypothetical protein Tco_1113006 [Tanacetum coccineum]|uniref:Uncharacterized protein n=1 Tax=Tanacetum coccineum TaxID=301880 RepID=A0ABQ5ITN6_9ASTR